MNPAFPDLHQRMQAVVLRARWIKWMFRDIAKKKKRGPTKRHQRLSDRLHAFHPIWSDVDTGEMDS